VNLLSRNFLLILGIVVLVGIAAFSLYYFILKPKGPVCGNDVCEYFEIPNCCIDCGCNPGSICNKKLNACEKRAFEISDERVIEIIENYYNSIGKNITSIRIADIVNVDDKIGRRSIVGFEADEWKAIIVTEDEQVIEEKKIG
jgi:hypothetical protein